MNWHKRKHQQSLKLQLQCPVSDHIKLCSIWYMGASFSWTLLPLTMAFITQCYLWSLTNLPSLPHGSPPPDSLLGTLLPVYFPKRISSSLYLPPYLCRSISFLHLVPIFFLSFKFMIPMWLCCAYTPYTIIPYVEEIMIFLDFSSLSCLKLTLSTQACGKSTSVVIAISCSMKIRHSPKSSGSLSSHLS